MRTTDEPTTALFRALMHPTRLAILDLLRHGEQCVCHLEAHLGKRQAYISQQLMVLREAGLVVDERDGLNVYYRVTNPQVFALIDTARAMLGVTVDTALGEDSQGNCPCPKCSPVAEVVLLD
jgi:ArsR family transcriptional regulator